MFRKLVSNLAFSPALIHEVGFYARRLRQEEATRKLTVLFTVLALVMQSLAVFSPPESANASSEQDIIRGGVSSLDDLLVRYDQNEEDIKDIYSALGITRTEVAAAEPATVYSEDTIYVMSRYGQFGDAEKEIGLSYAKSTGGMGIRYFSPLSSVSDSVSGLKGWSGTSATIGRFIIVQSSGSLATRGIPTSINPTGATNAVSTKKISAFNLTENKILSETNQAHSLDKISYTLESANQTNISVTSPMSVNVGDLLEYTNLIDGGGGTYEKAGSSLSWPQVQLAPGESQKRTFVVQLAATIPSTPIGKSNPASYDCNLSIAFGNSLNSPIDCPAPKVIESLLSRLPPTDTGINIVFALALLGTVSFFYVRTRQLRKEIRIIRHNFNTGII